MLFIDVPINIRAFNGNFTSNSITNICSPRSDNVSSITMLFNLNSFWSKFCPFWPNFHNLEKFFSQKGSFLQQCNHTLIEVKRDHSRASRILVSMFVSLVVFHGLSKENNHKHMQYIIVFFKPASCKKSDVLDEI